ncbi:hypothetical protein L6452_21716 [Arctium lappa]|uniref:Uncharacterized protein n=1 Tax=Arctium lappa TaxID=4217 RepID=A0ACB9AWZ5_ARCLA|nr:hypothetical protein L6452_21716 [Arctium lappa]
MPSPRRIRGGEGTRDGEQNPARMEHPEPCSYVAGVIEQKGLPEKTTLSDFHFLHMWGIGHEGKKPVTSEEDTWSRRW